LLLLFELTSFLLQSCVLNTVSQSWRIGKCLSDARKLKRDAVHALLTHQQGKLLFQGKVADVTRSTVGGFNRGTVALEGMPDCPYAGQKLHVDFQNEHLVARQGKTTVLAAVPDIICLLDLETGQSVPAEELRYGLRLSVVALPCAPLLRSERSLKVVGPKAFGYDTDYYPLLSSGELPSLVD